MIIYLQMIESDEDKSKFEQLYIMYKGLMFHVAMKILKNEFDAEDAVHQAFLSLIENLKKISDVKCPKTRAYYQDSDYCLRIYANDTGEKMFSVEYTLMQHTSMSTTAQEYSEVVKVDINGLPADLYIGNEASSENALIWVDEANQVVFNIQGNISNEDIVHIAQSLILSIPTK